MFKTLSIINSCENQILGNKLIKNLITDVNYKINENKY
jgi:hypothetical protein